MKRTFGNLVSVIGGEAMIRAANFAATLVIARVHGARIFGLYATALATTAVFVMFADNGLQTSAITELSNRLDGKDKIVGELYVAKTALTCVIIAVLVSVGLTLGFPPLVWMVGGLVAVRTILQSYSQLQLSMLKSIGQMKVIGVIQGLHCAVLMVGICIAFKQRWVILGLLGWLVAGQALELVLTVNVLWRAGIRLMWPAVGSCWALIVRSTPVGIAYGLANLIVRLDTIVLSVIVPLSEMGQFAAADMVLVIVYVVAWLFGSVVLPEMVRRSASSERLKAYVNRWSLLLFLTVAPCALFGFWVTPRIIPFLYGPTFSRAGIIVSVMMLGVPFILVNSLYANYAIATDSKATYLRIFAATAVATVGLNYFLGRSFGPLGVAWAILIRELGMFAGFSVLASRTSGRVAQLGVPVSS